MDQARQIALIEELLGHIASGGTSSADHVRYSRTSDYLSADVNASEREAFFDAHPLVAGLSADLKGPGDYVAQEIMGTPVLIVRGRDGVARGFYNLCRHRGARLVEDGAGCKRVFSCPFHAWSYDTQGSLVAISRQASFGDVDKATLGLRPLPTTEKYGLIWISRQPGPAIDIDAHLEGLGQELVSWQLETKVPFEVQAFESRANWKVALDTFGETYHLEALHRETLGPITHSNVHSYKPYGRNHRIVFAARNIEEMAKAPRDEWSLRSVAVITYYLFPNTEVVLAPNGTVSLVRLFPDRADVARTHTLHSSYLDAPADTDEAKAAARQASDSTTALLTDEDYAVAESVQRGLESGGQHHVLYGRNEPGVQHFHENFRAGTNRPPLPAWGDVNAAE